MGRTAGAEEGIVEGWSWSDRVGCRVGGCCSGEIHHRGRGIGGKTRRTEAWDGSGWDDRGGHGGKVDFVVAMRGHGGFVLSTRSNCEKVERDDSERGLEWLDVVKRFV